MNIVITPYVVKTIKSLPPEHARALSAALAEEFILGQDPSDILTPYQSILYEIIRSYVNRDMTI